MGDDRPELFADILLKRFTSVIGAEVGVDKGNFIFPLVEKLGNKCKMMYGIDPWKTFLSYRSWSQKDWDGVYFRLLKRAIKSNKNILLVRATSEAAAYMLPDNLNFVFIDAAHDFYSVLTDISLWEEKVVDGGILSGHDYKGKRKYWEVTDAVDHYVKHMGRELMTDIYGCWYWEVCK